MSTELALLSLIWIGLLWVLAKVLVNANRIDHRQADHYKIGIKDDAVEKQGD